jgi:hypothetical protein
MTDVGTLFATWLDDHGSYGVAAVNIFANSRPSTPHALVSFTQTAGGAPSMPMGGGGTQVRSPGLQMIVRGSTTEDYDVVYERAMAIHALIEVMLDVTLSGERIISVTPVDEPLCIEQDDQDRLVFASNYTINKE